MIKLHWHSGLIRIASFFNKKNCLLLRFIVALRNISILQFFAQRIWICICQNGFRDFSIAFADNQDFLICYFRSSDIRLMLRLPSNSSRAFFLRAEYPVQVSCQLQLLSSILHLFLLQISLLKMFVLFLVFMETFSHILKVPKSIS